jgi:hypothetical protein
MIVAAEYDESSGLVFSSAWSGQAQIESPDEKRGVKVDQGEDGHLRMQVTCVAVKILDNPR